MPDISAARRIDTTQPGVVNDDYTIKLRSPGWNKFLFGGTFASRSFALLEIDADGNEFPIKDEDGNVLSAVTSNVTFEFSGDRITTRMTGTGDANVLFTVQKLW